MSGGCRRSLPRRRRTSPASTSRRPSARCGSAASRSAPWPAASTPLRAEEAFFVWFKVCLVTGLVVGSPWIFWQVWMFVAAGLYPEEKGLVHKYLPISLGLFLAGVVICELFVIPKALEALLWFNEWL